MDFSVELIAQILYRVPLSPAKLVMQSVSKAFRQALQTPQAHHPTAQVEFPLVASCTPGTPREMSKVLPFVCLGAGQKDFSWVAFLDHLQILACEYGALRPISPLQNVQELILDAVDLSGDVCLFQYNPSLCLSYMFPNVKTLHVNGIPLEGKDNENDGFSAFMEDIEAMTLQLFKMDDYPHGQLPIVTDNRGSGVCWSYWDVTINTVPYNHLLMDLSDPVSAAPAFYDLSAALVTSLQIHLNETTRIDLACFNGCSRLERLSFVLADDTEPVIVFKIDWLPKSCCILQFINFEPYMPCFMKGWCQDSSQAGLVRI